jgi:seryl-tRNA synthetase
VIADFEDHRKTQYAATQIGSQINAIQKQIGQKKKAKENADELLKEKQNLTDQKKAKEDEAAEKLVKLNAKIKSIGNYVHDSVPVSDNEDNNTIVRTWAPEGVKPVSREKDGWLPHHGVLSRLNGADFDRGRSTLKHMKTTNH